MKDLEIKVGKALGNAMLTGVISGNEIADFTDYMRKLKKFRDLVVFLRENVGDNDDWNINIRMNEEITEEFLERFNECFDLLAEEEE